MSKGSFSALKLITLRNEIEKLKIYPFSEEQIVKILLAVLVNILLACMGNSAAVRIDDLVNMSSTVFSICF
jgi:hypothetical protein